MTSNEFVIWMKGIVVASNNYNITPSTWDEIKENLKNVKDNIPISNTGHQVFNTYTALHGTNTSSTIK
jgi:hypothetical protein